MQDTLFYRIDPPAVPEISLCDTANVKPPYVHFRRQAREYIFYYIHSGELALREDTRHYHLSDGDYILLDPTFEHEGLHATTVCFSYVHFTLEGLSMCQADTDEADRTAAGMSSNSAIATDNALAWGADKISSQILFPKSGHIDAEDIAAQFHHALAELLACRPQAPAGRLRQGSLFLELLALTAQSYNRALAHELAAGTRMGDTVLQLSRYLTVNYAQDITSSTLEELYHCNFDHLNRCFKKATGDTIFATLTRIRIDNAKKYLATGLYSCSETSVKCGFHDVYYFSKVFKKISGSTPLQYKRKWHEN